MFLFEEKVLNEVRRDDDKFIYIHFADHHQEA